MTNPLPAVGLTSRYLVIPVSEHEDTVGPLARTVKDAAYILQAIVGVDAHDNYTSAIPVVPDYVKACRMSGLSGIRIGIARNAIALEADNTTIPQTDAFEHAVQILRDAGAVIVENANFTAAEEYWTSVISSRVTQADFVVNLKKYLDALVYNPNNITSLAELRKFTQTFPLEDYPKRDTGTWDSALAGCKYQDRARI